METVFCLRLQVEAIQEDPIKSISPGEAHLSTEQRQRTVSETSCFKYKTELRIMSRILIVIRINIPLSQTYRYFNGFCRLCCRLRAALL
jgi:hypothetical protein